MSWLGIIIIGAGVLALTYKVQPEPTASADDGSGTDPFTRFDDLFKKSSLAHDLRDPWMIKAICMTESNLGQAPSVARGLLVPTDVDGSVSDDGKSWGIMQITLPTARDFDPSADEVRLNDPAYSVDLAGRFIRHLQDVFPIVLVDWEEWVVKAYNEGEGNAQKERAGKIDGFAAEYWARYQRNRQVIRDKQGV